VPVTPEERRHGEAAQRRAGRSGLARRGGGGHRSIIAAPPFSAALQSVRVASRP
jgi:hypothetical protein